MIMSNALCVTVAPTVPMYHSIFAPSKQQIALHCFCDNIDCLSIA